MIANRHAAMAIGVTTAALALTGCLAESGAAARSERPFPMRVGVDEAGAKAWIQHDPQAQEAFARIGFDFIVHHFWGQPSTKDIDSLIGWAEANGYGFIYNAENSPAGRQPADPGLYRNPGAFWQPSREFLERCLASPQFLGLCFDECEHWTTNGVWVTAGRDFVPQFYDADGTSLEDAYAGNVHNLSLLMDRVLPELAANASWGNTGPFVGTENVFPILHHLFARCGLVQMPKLLKETVTPVTLAMAMGAAKQYRSRHWTSVDLWGPGGYPGHSPEELHSALLISYWTGAEATYVENLNYRDSLYRVEDGSVILSPHGQTVQRFIREYLPTQMRHVRIEAFTPDIVIVRFPDSDWGQATPRPWIRNTLYGAHNLVPDADTRAWINVWHLLTHGVLPARALNYNESLGIPYRVFFPANNVAVYDHLAADPELYAGVRLVFLVGKAVAPACLTTLQRLVRNGLTVCTTTRLAPADVLAENRETPAVMDVGRGRWIITDDVTDPAAKALLAPFLGKPDQLRYAFGSTDVVFTAPEDPGRLEVTVRER